MKGRIVYLSVDVQADEDIYSRKSARGQTQKEA